MKNYQLLHAVEKPINFDYTKPFASTNDLKNMTPNIDHDLAYERMSKRQKDAKKDQEGDVVQEIEIKDKKESQADIDESKEKQEFSFNY